MRTYVINKIGEIMYQEQELEKIFLKTFPFIIRDKKVVKKLLECKDNIVFEERDEDNNLVGISVVNENTILLLCVDKEQRNKGIGSRLLKKSEHYILSRGYDKVNVGAGFDYLMPGVPVNKKVFDENLGRENIFIAVDETAYNFFKKRGYHHSWGEANCFDLIQDLTKFNQNNIRLGKNINGIVYEWAKLEDLNKVVDCVNDGHSEFTKFYQNDSFYSEDSKQRVLIAKDKDLVVGCIIINCETEEKEMGSAGCTTVRHSHRKRHIASNMVILGTQYLKERGLKKSYISYTYSGLDKLYGYAGYEICIYYFMAEKDLND